MMKPMPVERSESAAKIAIAIRLITSAMRIAAG